jgi:hypothetical protein
VFSSVVFSCLTSFISKLSLPTDTVVTSCTSCSNARTLYFTHEPIFVFHVIVGGGEASFSPNGIKQLIFIIQVHCVICEVITVSK